MITILPRYQQPSSLMHQSRLTIRKALLGADSNRSLLVHFLNSVLIEALPKPISEVTILNPYNEREFSDDKLSVVDVKACDQAGGQFQIEIQLLTHRDLRARILYGSGCKPRR